MYVRFIAQSHFALSHFAQNFPVSPLLFLPFPTSPFSHSAQYLSCPFTVSPNFIFAHFSFRPEGISPNFPISPKDHFALFPQGLFSFRPNSIFLRSGPKKFSNNLNAISSLYHFAPSPLRPMPFCPFIILPLYHFIILFQFH